MARTAKRGEVMETATVRMVAADWHELASSAGALRPEIVRQLVAAFLGRQGAVRLTPAQRAQLAELAADATATQQR
jgi:hypothetical protein